MRPARILPLLLLAISACTSQKQPDLQWLEGTWQRTYNATVQQEVWEFRNDSLIGTSLFITGTDTTLSERMYIVQENNRWVFIADVPENEFETRFVLQESAANTFHVSNPDHDFPQHISYTVSGDSLTAEIRGNVQGVEKQAEFRFGRVKR